MQQQPYDPKNPTPADEILKSVNEYLKRSDPNNSKPVDEILKSFSLSLKLANIFVTILFIVILMGWAGMILYAVCPPFHHLFP
jgi:uncharacterized protein YbcC (UPF0753/DUF2309 family)